MTTVGSIKTQVTKAVKALRASMDDAEEVRTGQLPSNTPAVKSASVSRGHYSADSISIDGRQPSTTSQARPADRESA
ncbi:unnamed protein product [Heligmosomoides polygyrus]|uniref:Protein of unassigned function n=1 Tax=Heligmosomoides polygyrus TaxID=6339 RepID=A0A183GR92_HELPZ|nr:unnamed protein product [Heligmosomoides polygyrus]